MIGLDMTICSLVICGVFVCAVAYTDLYLMKRS